MDFTDTILQYGALGISAMLIGAIMIILKYIYQLVSTHLAQNNEISMKNIETMTKLISVIERNTDNVHRSIEIMKRVERQLDQRGCDNHA